MEISRFIEFAKVAQSILSKNGYPAEHIYLVGYSKILETDFKPSLVFVSPKYDSLDLYTRAKLAITIHQGPLNINYYVLGPSLLQKSNLPITKEAVFNSIKLFGKKPLQLSDTEFASAQDMNMNTNGDLELTEKQI